MPRHFDGEQTVSIRHSRIRFGWLLWLLASVLLVACQQPASLEGYDVVYFVPRNGAEEIVAPEKFSESDVMKVGITNSWQAIVDLQAQGQLKAVIIHHSMVDKVNTEQLADWFANGNVVVAGIGIKGDALAELVGMPSFYPGPWLDSDEYETPDFFYIYENRTTELTTGTGISSESFQRANVDYMLSALAGHLAESDS